LVTGEVHERDLHTDFHHPPNFLSWPITRSLCWQLLQLESFCQYSVNHLTCESPPSSCTF
jgi:hypothetical protein